ncbi:MAG: prepilin-type N-terminal cleavage/methylation domain-containing protein [Desulfobacterales bacterium]|jgi:prepilin-type N-terminal cleavage/methylation domain-containing protein
MFVRVSILDQKGFTLIELISIMVIMGVVASVGVKKLDLLSGTATTRVITEGIRELNVRESLTWTNIKLTDTGYTSDDDLFTVVETDLGGDFKWTAGPNASVGTLSFRSTSIILNRTRSTGSSAGSWK